MTYRDPQPRPPRLWLIVVSFSVNDGIIGVTSGTGHAWLWRRESHEAIDKVTEDMRRKYPSLKVTGSIAVCGEDFVEKEAKGPPSDDLG